MTGCGTLTGASMGRASGIRLGDLVFAATNVPLTFSNAILRLSPWIVIDQYLALGPVPSRNQWVYAVCG